MKQTPITPEELEQIYYDLEVQEERSLRLYRLRLMAHPYCDDLGHPGCSQCIEEEPDV